MSETVAFQRETREPRAIYGKTLSLSLSSLSRPLTFPILWRAACISIAGTLCPIAEVRVPSRNMAQFLARQYWGELRGDVGRSSELTLAANEQGCAERLARFFPGATPVRVPVLITALRGGSARLREATVVEFGGSEHAIFLSSLPLEFNDPVRIERDRNGCTADAKVIAVQYHEGRKAVAVRFLQGPCAWVTQP